ncbi:50S ribosomal protein L11 methyltransferase [Geomonas azotofigens]|uniref:50S ribosomal protein L11 methyltransferase n=1 Tax=Geomonas azotofigens TaxID=2843196 RepID=UPI001C0F70E2|nr:50S ribosomal protein L11 methyltransferase [Geomonas azotofigens]MBU5612081.1 50S ribosomal protein L11 methyltransferase [Geomonas azotofigens]
MITDWAEIACDVPAEMVDTLADFLVELTGNGVGVDNLHLDTFSLDTLEDTSIKTVKGYLPLDDSLEDMRIKVEHFLAQHGPDFPGFVYTPPVVSIIKNEDWANNWKVHFKPVRIGNRLVIKPTWEEYQRVEGDLVIQIDPGMAFGTGAHPTTKMCLESLERIAFAAEGGKLPNPVLDVGTGSGVLSIAAALLGATEVTAVDIDPEAVRVTQENLELNGVDTVVKASTTDLSQLPGGYAVVVANILAEELVRLSDQLTSRVAPGGWLILSGILTEKEEFVRAGFPALELVENPRELEWSCLTLRKPF